MGYSASDVEKLILGLGHGNPGRDAEVIQRLRMILQDSGDLSPELVSAARSAVESHRALPPSRPYGDTAVE